MALRNAFENVSTESKQDSIISAVNSRLTNTELRASDVEVNDDAAQALLNSIVGALGDTVTAGTVRELLLRIYGAVDGLELSVDNINLNTDTLEAKLDTLNAKDFATQTTLEAARVLLASINTELATQQKDALTNTQLRATPISVTDTNPPQTDAITNLELRASDLEVNDNAAQAILTAIDNALGDTATTNTVIELLLRVYNELTGQQIDALTNTQLRATPIGVTVSNPTADPETGLAKDTTLQDVKRSITDYETRLDYDVRTDSNPVYVGKAAQGSLTSDTTWTVQRLDYDASNRLVRVQVVSGIAWDNRGGAF